MLVRVTLLFKLKYIIRRKNVLFTGKIEGKEYCQEFLVGHGYSIAFLEPMSLNLTDHKTFTPADFVEIHVGKDVTNQLVTRTCEINLTVPLRSVASVNELCPTIVFDPICQEILTTDNKPSDSTTTIDNVLSYENEIASAETVITSVDNNSSQSRDPIEQEIFALGSKPKTSLVNVDKKSDGNSMKYSFIFMIIALFLCIR